MLYVVSIGIIGVLILGYGIDYFFSCLDDPCEPRRVNPTVPVIGHILGFVRHGYDYYSFTSQLTNAEIYTIGICNFKVYVTNGTRLAHIAQKTKTLSFGPLFRVSNKVNADVSDESNALYSDQVVDDLIHRTKETLAPGLDLDSQNMRMGEEALEKVTDLVKNQKEVHLYAWAQHAILQATATGLYGVQHPFKDRSVEDALWIWDDHRPGHAVGIDILGRGYKARSKVFKAFQKYFENIPDDVSQIVRERQRILCESGIPKDDISKIQSTLSDAAYPNTVPTMFWTVFEVYSRPELLDTVRQEVSDNAVRRTQDGFVLDVAALKTKCPVLLSTYQETQRTRHSQVAFRMVTEDTLLDGKFLLKKDNILNMPAKPTHKNPELWGNQADTFEPYRFVPQTSETKTKVSSSNFMPWGSAPYMCPARQFASTEILIITALLCLNVDLIPANGQGWVRKPVLRGMEIPTLPRPKYDMRLKVVPRKEGAAKWEVAMGESRTRVPLMSG